MPKLDTANAVDVPAGPLPHEVVLTTPSMPGFEVHIPAGATVTDPKGNPVRSLSITPVPLDRPTFPTPAFSPFTMHYTIQPANTTISSPGARLVYPNYSHLAPGFRVRFWQYEADGDGWESYGKGTVSSDASRIEPDPGVTITSFLGSSFSGNVPPKYAWTCGIVNGHVPPPPRRRYPCSADPVDLSNGLTRTQATDLSEPGPMPLDLSRVYRQNDATTWEFGLGMATWYDMRLSSTDSSSYVDLWVPGAPLVHFTPTGISGTPMTANSSPTDFDGALMQTGPYPEWDVRTHDGSRYIFNDTGAGLLNEVRDRFGNRVILFRDANSRVTDMVEYPTGRWIHLDYYSSGPGNGMVSAASDGLGRHVTYTYENPGTGIVRLKNITDANQTTQPNPKPVIYTWSTDLTINSNPSSSPSPATYLMSIQDARGNLAIQNHYDSQGRVDLQTFPNTGTYSFAYGTDSQCPNQTKVTDPNGNITCTTVDASDDVTSTTEAVGTSSARTYTYTYDPATGRLLTVTDSFHSRQTTIGYDSKGNAQTITDLAGTGGAVTTTTNYDPGYGQVTSIQDPLSHTTNFGYTFGCLTSVTDARNIPTTIVCNTAGQPTSVTDNLGHQTTVGYDHGDAVRATDALGRKSTVLRDDAGRVLAVTDALGERTKLTYDNLGNLTKATDPRAKSSTLAYDENSNLTSITQDPTGGTTTYACNAMNWLTTRTDALGQSNPSGHQDVYTYDLGGNVSTWTDRKANVMKYCYDAFDRPTFVGYNASGTPTCASSYESTLNLTYDGGGRLTQIADSTTGAGTIIRGFDDLDRLTSEQSLQGTVSYEYDNASRRSKMTVTGQTAVTYGYFNDNLIQSLTRGTKVVGFTYDGANRPATETLPNGVVQTYTFDVANELTKISYDDGATNYGVLSYGYDPAGHRTQVWNSWARTSLPTATTQNATYDLANELKTWNGTNLNYDNDGHLTGFGGQTYLWNARGQLSSTSGGTTSFTYDGVGRRVSKAIPGSATSFLYDASNVVQDTTGSNVASELEGPGIDQTYWRTEVGGTTTTRNYLTDALGSTVALTDGSATPIVKTTYTYEPYGNPTVAGTSRRTRSSSRAASQTERPGCSSTGHGICPRRLDASLPKTRSTSSVRG
ncbi:MAG: DUF6531 domain-containing protein [Actinomycetota bacterium]|nr:DUF6531 domain-containing protein [Actinomycetota bacterium]